MTSSSYYRVLSYLCVIGVVAYYAWITVVPFGYPGAPIAAVVMLGLLFATLKLGVRKPVDYWEAVADPPQAGRVTLMILVGLAIQLALSVGVRMVDQMTLAWSNAVYLLVWTGVPLAFIGLGIVRWPRRRASPGTGEFLTVASVAILLAAGVCYLGSLPYDGPRVTPSSVDLAIGGGVNLLGATMEEVVFRVLLLTALVQASGSRLHALILSSVFFALFHAPPALWGPIVEQDWAMLPLYVTEFLPELVWQIGFGFLFGALWLRTGSITLIAVVHAISNLGPVLVGGLNGL